MSYEGYVQYLCKVGHYIEQDCYMDDLTICPVCKKEIVWHNDVDITNGSYEGDERIDGHIELKIKKQQKCKHCKTNLETRYVIPEKTK